MARMKPLQLDKNDEASLRNGAREFGHANFNAHVPMFFSKYGGEIDLTGHYHGRACFLVSNGPSLSNVDLERLKQPGVMIISLNNGAATLLQNGITPHFWVCVDHPSRFVKQIWLNPAITKFTPTASFDKELWDNEEWKPLKETCGVRSPQDCPNVIGYKRNEKFAAHRFFTEASFNWGCHKKWGGKRTVLLPAIRIPFILGFRKLYMLGVDLNMSTENTYHFDEGRTEGAVRGNQSTYKRIIEEYGPGIQKEAVKLGYEIYNCNPDSALRCFPYYSFEQAVDDVTKAVGRPSKIRTAGMYVDWKQKPTLSREDAIKRTAGVASS